MPLVGAHAAGHARRGLPPAGGPGVGNHCRLACILFSWDGDGDRQSRLANFQQWGTHFIYRGLLLAASAVVLSVH